MRSLLIANRGEIARRIIRTARRMGIATVAVHSEADAGLPFVREADRAVCLGPAPARESYLVAEKILAAARETGAEAIHPGYGFLSENAEFAEAAEAAGLIWVGAPPAAIRAMGRTDAAKALMAAAGVPVTPGAQGDAQSPARLAQEAGAIGWPVLIKAVAGGGGKGMRRVDRAEDFADALESCRREAAGAFGDDRVLIEKYILAPRHVEVQVFGDRHGGAVHLFERDCSLQRRHQKVIEEAPAPGMDAATRAAVCDAAVRAARAVDYVGAGTIEFIADASEGLRADRIWFMEMNTRLQVEHPVTEAITGQDLVEWQIRVARGEPSPVAQEDLRFDGWAMEARLYAENPATGFLPSIGRLDHLRLPEGIRVDAGVEEGSTITPHYDPMIAKLITHAPTREAAAARLADACAGVEVWPVRTNAGFLARAAADPAFVAGEVDTGFIERHADRLIPPKVPSDALFAAAARVRLAEARGEPLPAPGRMPGIPGGGLSRQPAPRGFDAPEAPSADPWAALPGFRLNAPPDRRVAVAVDGEAREVAVDPAAPLPAVVRLPGVALIFAAGEGHAFGAPETGGAAGGGAGDGVLLAPMPGTVVAVAVAQGERVTAGQRLVVLEAMKMEQAMLAPFAGRVEALEVAPGAQVAEGALLVRVAPE